MFYTVYILYSSTLDRYYVGQTEDLGKRLFRHNNSGNPYTKKAKDWKVVHAEDYPTRPSAVAREKEIKKKKSRRYIELLVKNNSG